MSHVEVSCFLLGVFLNFNSGAKWSTEALPREVFCWLWEELVLDLFATFPSQWRCFLIAQARSVKRKIHIAKTGGKIDRVQRLLDQCFPLENHWLFPCYSPIQEERTVRIHFQSKCTRKAKKSLCQSEWTQSYCKVYHIWMFFLYPCSLDLVKNNWSAAVQLVWSDRRT